MNFENGFLADIHFDSIEMLKKGFSAFEPLLPKEGFIYEFNLRLHWTPATLSTRSLVECRNFVNSLCDRYEEFPVYIEFPFCTGDKAQYASFPDCDNCSFLEADWCRWPRQMGRYYKEHQKKFTPAELNTLQLKDFEPEHPKTWFYPLRQQIKKVAHQLGKSNNVFDFGAGNGFVTYLIQQELSENHKVHAVDPFVKPSFQEPNFSYSKELPETMPDSWSLFSSLGDYHVPFDLCLDKKTLPRDIVFIRFPSVFGKPGNRTCLTIKQGEITKIFQEKLFDISRLEKLGYQQIHLEDVPSTFYDDTELRIFSLQDKSFDFVSGTDSYPWEKSWASRKPTISEDSLL